MRRWTKRVGALVCVLFLLSGAAYLGRERVLAPFVVARAAEVLRASTGLELRVGRLGGNWWSEIELEDCRLDGGTPTTELTSLHVGKAVAHFDLRGLINGDLNAIHSIDLGDASVKIDLAQRSSAERPVVVPGANLPPFPWPANLPPIEVRDASVSLDFGAGMLLELGALDLLRAPAPNAGTFAWKLDVGRGLYRDVNYGERSFRLAGEARYRAGVFESPRLDLEGGASCRDFTLDLRELERSRARFGGTLDLGAGELELHGAVGGGGLELWVGARELELAALLSELRVTTTLAGRANLTGVFRAPLASIADWTAHASGQVDELRFLERHYDHLEFAGSFDAEDFEIREGTLIRGPNTLALSNFGFSLADTGLEGVLRSLHGSAKLEVLDAGSLLVAAAPEVLRAADRVRRAQLSFEFSPTGFQVRTGLVRTDVGGLVVQRGSGSWGPRSLPWYEGLLIDLDAALSFEDLAPVAALFGQGDVQGALAGTLALSGPLTSPSGRFRLSGSDLSLFGSKVGAVAIEARADNARLRLERLELDGPLGYASASGDFEYANGVLSNARVRGRTFALEQWSNSRASAGLLTFDANFAGPWRDPRVGATVQAWDLEFPEAAAAGSPRMIEQLELSGAFAAGCARIDQLEAKVAGVDVSASGSFCIPTDLSGPKVLLDRARLSRQELDLTLESQVELEFPPAGLIVRGLCVSGSAGRANADIVWTGNEKSIAIDAAELHPMQLLRPFLPEGMTIEGVHGSLAYRHTGADLALDVDLRVDELGLFADAPPGTLSFIGKLSGRELLIRQLVLSAPGHFGLALSGRVPVDPLATPWIGEGPLELAGDAIISDLSRLPLRRLGLSEDWRGNGTARFQLDGTSSQVGGSLETRVEIAGFPDDPGLSRGPSGTFQFEGAARLGESLKLERARLWLPERVEANFEGEIGLRLNLRRWLIDGPPVWDELPLSFSSRISVADLGFVAGLSSNLRRTAGELTGKLDIGGTLGAPTLTGNLDLSRAEVRLANSLAAFENLAAAIELDGMDLRINSLTGDYGAAPFAASGTVAFGRHEPQLDLKVKGEGLLLARDEGLRLRADADLALVGALSALKLSGEFMVVDGRFSKDFKLVSLPGSVNTGRTSEVELPFLRELPWANIEFDVRIGSRRPIRVETNIVWGTLEPQLELRGSGAAPRLEGTLVIGSGRVKLPAANLDVTSGLLTFRGGNRLTPDLDISAITRVRGYDITARVSGTSAEPELLFSSSPPLASEELAVLVLTGQLPETALSARGSEAAVETVAVYLGRDIMTRWLGIEGESEDPISERFEFYRGAEVSQTGIESTEFIFRLTPNPKGKSRILFLRAEEDVYEHVNFGVKLLFRFR